VSKGRRVVVDLTLCKACGICVSLCPRQVFDEDDEGRPVVARIGDCTACRLCEWHCPDLAIEVIAGRAADESGAATDVTEQADEHAARVAAALLRAKQRDHRHEPSDGGHHEVP
jgi:2-oxoglutarate ferredoxin oxidoreductase subunit delta